MSDARWNWGKRRLTRGAVALTSGPWESRRGGNGRTVTRFSALFVGIQLAWLAVFGYGALLLLEAVW